MSAKGSCMVLNIGYWTLHVSALPRGHRLLDFTCLSLEATGCWTLPVSALPRGHRLLDSPCLSLETTCCWTLLVSAILEATGCWAHPVLGSLSKLHSRESDFAGSGDYSDPAGLEGGANCCYVASSCLEKGSLKDWRGHWRFCSPPISAEKLDIWQLWYQK